MAPRLSIPLNGFECQPYMPRTGVAGPFNSIEWILIIDVDFDYWEGVKRLSIPLNGFVKEFETFERLVVKGELSIPLNGFLLRRSQHDPLPASLLSIPLNGFPGSRAW